MNGLWVVVGALVAASGAGGQGHRLERDRLHIAEDHWREWDFPQGTLRFSGAGVQPAFIRAQSNAALDAGAFSDQEGVSGGIRAAGSRPEQAGRLIDGREDTFWEPDPQAPLREWWVEIDLGRVVWARKVKVRFAGAGEGDPFLQFKLLASNGQSAFSQSKTLDYRIVGRSEGLNKTQRVFEFELRPTLEADPGFSGDLIRYVQVVATASDQGQAEELSQVQWDSLPEAERGDIRYFRRLADGSVAPVDRAEYEAIADPGQRGPIRYYRRERPRLAEVEVWTAGDNLSLGALERGGKILGYGSLGAEVRAIDGDYTTFWSVEVGFATQGFGTSEQVIAIIQDPDRDVFFDLGAWYWVDRALLIFFRLAFPNYVITLSDGRRAPDGSLLYTPLAASGPSRSTLLQDNSFAPTKARFFKLDYHVVNYSVVSGIQEIQLYGRGFLPQVSLNSGLIALGQTPRVLSAIEWEADTPPGTRLEIRTRTGDQLAREVRYFTKTGAEVSEAQYRKLLSFQRGDSLVAFVPGADWSNWSQGYPRPGAAITSPSPRRYAMIQATLLSDDPEQAVLLRRLSVGLDDPLAGQVLGEIAPARADRLGQSQVFTLFLRPQFQAGDRGFDQVLLEVPPGAEVELLEVAVGPEQEPGGGRRYGPAELRQVESSPDSLWVRLPETVQGAQELVALRFSGVFYLASNTFVALVGLGEEGREVWQRVDAGEATSLGRGAGMQVLAPFGGALLGEVAVGPNPFTPNGDGANDQVEFAFSVFKVQGQKSLVLEVYGLDGRRVRRVEEPVAHAAGRQRLEWDGRDDRGRLAPPGLYLCRVGLEVDAADIAPPAAARWVVSVY